MVAGHLQEKRGLYHIVLSYKVEANGKTVRKTKWIATGLEVKGNKKRAEAMLQDARMNFEPPNDTEANTEAEESLLFADFLIGWVEIVKPSIAIQTYASYHNMAHAVVGPHFRALGIELKALEPKHIQEFYSKRMAEGRTAKPRFITTLSSANR